MDIKIFIATHKPCQLPEQPCYYPIQVGAQGKDPISYSQVGISERTGDIIRDDCGENISQKNPYYCELTATYYIWKNITADVVGLCHYRRYFAFDKQNAIKELFFYPEKQTADYQPDLSKIERDLKSGLTIVGKKQCLPLSLGVCYSITHVSEDIYTLKQP